MQPHQNSYKEIVTYLNFTKFDELRFVIVAQGYVIYDKKLLFFEIIEKKIKIVHKSHLNFQ
jgi:hypothetical protein